jgi:gliding motility-associated-like protein
MTVTDINNNTQTCTFIVEVVDVTPPAVECLPNITVANDLGECGAIVSYMLPTATDNCAVATVELTEGLASGQQFPVGETQMEITVTDTSGNQTTCLFTVTVNDTEAPVIECPVDQTLEADGNCEAIIPDYTSLVETWDNCSTEFTLVQLPAPGETAVGEQLVAVTVTDDAGNSTICGFMLEVVDTTAPQIECAEDMVQVDSIVLYQLPQVTDNCYAELELIEGLAPGEEFDHGYTTVTYTATDAYGNADTCSFEILVNTPPVGVNDSLILESHIDQTEFNVLENDIDVDGDELTLTDAWTSSDDTEVWIEEDGTIEYEVYEEWCGTDTITYEMCDQYGACTQALLIIEVECYNGIVVPEGFSPNGDVINDKLEIHGILHFPEARVEIYNRWGRAVYKTVGYQNDWEGFSTDALTIGDEQLPEGTYFIYINLEDGSKPIKAYVYLRN